MGNRAQKRPIANDRSRLTERGIVRFELQVFETDRDLIRTLARKLVEEGPAAGQIRRTVQQAASGEPRKPGGILAALRRSPLLGAGLDLTRPRNSRERASSIKPRFAGHGMSRGRNSGPPTRSR